MHTYFDDFESMKYLLETFAQCFERMPLQSDYNHGARDRMIPF